MYITIDFERGKCYNQNNSGRSGSSTINSNPTILMQDVNPCAYTEVHNMKRLLTGCLSAVLLTAGMFGFPTQLNAVFASQYDELDITEMHREKPYIEGKLILESELYFYHAENEQIIIDECTDACSKLDDLIVPSEIDGLPVTEIADEAFFLCSMKSLTIPDSIRKIGICAFAECRNLQTVNLPAVSPEYVGQPFLDTPYMKAKQKESPLWIENGVLLDAGISDESYTIPDNVQCIGMLAFASCKTLKNLTVPDGVILNQGAFFDFECLETIRLPETMTDIPDRMFDSCISLQSLQIPEVVTSIGEMAFAFCKSLRSVSIPDSVKSIGDWAFTECKSLTELTVPSSVSSIGNCAFNAYYLKKIYAEPGSYAAKYAKEHDIMCFSPDSTDTLHKMLQCEVRFGTVLIRGFTEAGSGTETLNIPAEIGGFPVCEIDWAAFRTGGENLTTVRLPDTLKIISGHAFEGCEKLTSVTLPNGLEKIGEEAFCNCKSLTEITLPASINEISSETFDGCDALRKVIFADGWKRISEQFEDTFPMAKEIVLPDGLEYIGANVFLNCPMLEALTIPASVKEIGDRAIPESILLYVTKGSYAQKYAQLHGYLHDVIGEGHPHYDAASPEMFTYHDENGQIIIDKCSVPDTQYTAVVIPDYINNLPVAEIGKQAFEACRFRKIILPQYLERIGDSAFDGCHSLTKITVPDSLKVIGEDAFRDCGRLSEISLPEGLTSIGKEAFTLCASLEKVQIPDSVSFIGEDAFYTDWLKPGHGPILTGSSGGYAETYAKEHFLRFEAIESESTTTIGSTTQTTATTTLTTATTTISSSVTGFPNTTTEQSGTTSDLPQTGVHDSAEKMVVYGALALLCLGIGLTAYSNRRKYT